jgi:hypothetical protein
MKWMNRWDIDEAQGRWASGARSHPVLEAAVQTLRNLRDYADANSDGWAYWPKPARAANRLKVLIEADESALTDNSERRYTPRTDATEAALRKAYAPIKAFCTRQGIDSTTIIVEPTGAATNETQETTT